MSNPGKGRRAIAAALLVVVGGALFIGSRSLGQEGSREEGGGSPFGPAPAAPRGGEITPPSPPESEVYGLVLGPPPRSWFAVDVPPPPPLLGPGLVIRGAALYAARCLICHGPSGTGDGWLAPHLDPRPRDLIWGRLAYRTTTTDGPPLPSDVFRTVTAGITVSGMPSGDDLSAGDRWAIVCFLMSVSDEFQWGTAETAYTIPEVPPGDPGAFARGRAVYERMGCIDCHDRQRTNSTQFDLGPYVFKAGATPRDILRSVVVGAPGTPMPAFGHLIGSFVSMEDLRDLARYIAQVAEEGRVEREAKWAVFFASRRIEIPGPRQTEGLWRTPGTGPDVVPADAPNPDGCLGCHQGIEGVGEPMETALRVMGGTPGRACALCHGGEPRATTRRDAHHGMIPDPGNLWAVALGMGCARCHASRGSLTTLQGELLPEAVGGLLMSVRSPAGDPSGGVGADHAYRMQRGLMATEMGKATHTLASAGFIGPGTWTYADFDLDDPDGPLPRIEGPYREWASFAEKTGWLPVVDEVSHVPTADEAHAIAGPDAPVPQTLLVEYYRKVCAACHLFGEGRGVFREFRGGGCSACHVPTNDRGTYEGADPTIPRDRPPHSVRHQVVTWPPASQCIRCHTSYNLMEHWDLHLERGMSCADCHNSVDLHGDGNIYPTKQFQVEVRCEDCHGTPWAYPWDLPLGFGSGAVMDRPRGTYTGEDGRDYIRSSRGNPWSFVWREGDRVYQTYHDTNTTHESPLITGRLGETCWSNGDGFPEETARVHLERFACQTCHATRTFRCFGCHFTYDPQRESPDLLLGVLDHDPATRRARHSTTPGHFTLTPIGGTPQSVPPRLAPDLSGRLAPWQYPCQYVAIVLDEAGHSTNYPLGWGQPSSLAIAAPHEGIPRPRGCASCHDPVPEPPGDHR